MNVRLTKAALLSLALLLAACGTSEGGSSDDPSTEPSTDLATDGTDDPGSDDPGSDDPGSDDPGSDDPGSDEPSGDAVEVDEWAQDFCGSFEGWISEIQTVSSDLGSNPPSSPDEAKQLLDQLFGTTSELTQDLIGDLEANGVPDIDDGEALVDDLIARFEAFDSATIALQDELNGLDPTDAGYQAEATELITSWETEVQTVADSFEQLDTDYPSEELNAALEDACSF